jgi:TrmH family RNA methyltransferase
VYKQISSIQNPLIKEVLQLQEKSRTRKNKGLFIIEGAREISLALKGNYEIETLLFYPELFDISELKKVTNENSDCIEITKDVYQKIAYRSTTEGVIAIAKTKDLDISSLKLSKNPLLLIAESPEKPGNLGALLRTADAAHLDAVIIANPKTDIYNPNIIRSSVGCVFTNSIAIGTTNEIIDFLKQKNIPIYTASLTASVPYTTIDFTKSAAIVVGTEATGLSNKWLENASQNIIIPMQGEIDSLNVSVSAAILIFEAKRQRNLN